MIENVKSAVLTILVLLSAYLTWSIWTYQPDYEMQQAEYIQDVAIGEKKSSSVVVTPLQMVMHKNNKHYTTTSREQMKKLYTEMKSWTFHTMEPVNISSDEQFQSILKKAQSVELMFPTEVPFNIYKTIFQFSDKDRIVYSFDRIILDLSNENGLPEAYFVSSNARQVYHAQISNVKEEQFENSFFEINELYHEVFIYKVGENKEFYLPVKPTKVDKLTYMADQLSPMDFRDALFPDPSIVKRYASNFGEESYTDGTMALEIHSSKNLMKFTNPLRKEPVPVQPEILIQNSIEYVNEHAGWIDHYILFDWDLKSRSTLFRMMLNDYPVFDSMSGDVTNDMSVIFQSWSNDQINIYSRSMIDLYRPFSKPEPVTLPSGIEVIDYLEQSVQNFSSDAIEDITIGYDFGQDLDSVTFITFQPAWFIQVRGHGWVKVPYNIPEVLEMEKGGKDLGME